MGSFDLTRGERRGMIVLAVVIAVTALIGAYDSVTRNRPQPQTSVEAVVPDAKAMESAARTAERDSAKAAGRARKRKNARPKKQEHQPSYRDMLDERARR